MASFPVFVIFILLTEDGGCYFYCYCRLPLQPRYQILMLMFAVGVVEMLLLMAGDVERNPGPGIVFPAVLTSMTIFIKRLVVTELKLSDLVTVLRELLEAAADWKDIGLTLLLGLLSALIIAVFARRQRDTRTAEYPEYNHEYYNKIIATKNPDKVDESSWAQYASEVLVIVPTVNENEYWAVVDNMQPPEGCSKCVIYKHGSVLGTFGDHKAALVQTKMGHDCQNEIERALEDFPHAQAIVAVGIAYASSRKYKFADVLVSTHIEDLVNAKFTRDDQIFPRGVKIKINQALTDTFCKQIDVWGVCENFICTRSGSSERRPIIHKGVIISAPWLIDNANIKDKLLDKSPEAIGGEMEGGILLRIQDKLFEQAPLRRIGVIVIKGVADFADGSKGKQWQLTAAKAAAGFARFQLKRNDSSDSRAQKLAMEGGDGRQKQKVDKRVQDSPEVQLDSSDRMQGQSVEMATQESGIAAVTSVHSQDPLDLYASYLRGYYLRYDFPDYDKLPASPSKKYTRLASVLKVPVTKQEADELTKETIQGNIDDIKNIKTSITMEEIAPVKNGSFSKCILVEGTPGIGKTTFSWEMCRKWSKGAILKDYKLVVLLRLRDEKVRQANCVSDLFRYSNKEVQQQVVQMIEETGGKGVLLLFEGYDELPANLRTKNSFFTDVIKGNELLEATVLVTSRPSASGFLYENCQHCINQHIEILGFTSADVHSYLKETCGENASLLSGLQKYLQCYPHIRTMMYVPLNAGIVVEVYRTSKDNNSVIAKTKTQLYQCLVCSLLRRYLSDHPVHGKKKWSIRSFKGLPEDVYKQFCELARIADEGIRNNQQVIFNDLPEDFDTLGLMQCVPELYVDRGAAVSHSFPHLTIQEFMAAFHISQGTAEQWQEKFDAHSDHEKMVMRFVAGLTKLEGVDVCHQDDGQEMFEQTSVSDFSGETPGLKIPLRVSMESPAENKATFDRFHWIFEAQTDYPGSKGSNKEVIIRNISRDRFDWYVLGYCIAHSDKIWKIELDLMSFIADEAIKGLVQVVLECKGEVHSGISKFKLGYECITSEGVQYLSELPKHMLSSLKSLSLRNNHKIGEGGCAPLVEMLPATLVYFNLSNTGIGVEDCRALNKLLTSSSSLKSLNISGNYLPPEAVELIFSGLQASTTMKGLMLYMSCSQFSMRNCKSLASVLQNNNGTLRGLKLDIALRHQFDVTHETQNNYLQLIQESFTAIHGSVTSCQFPHIQASNWHYVLGYCVSHTTYTWEIQLGGDKGENFRFQKVRIIDVDDAEVEEFVRGLLDYEAQPQSTITSLTICHSMITAEGIRQILKIPKHMLSSLRKLALTDSPKMDVECYTALNTLLESSATLETLDLRGNDLSPEAVAVVLNGLQNKTGLKVLELSIGCSQLSVENCKSLALVIQNSNGTLRKLKMELDRQSKLNLEFLQEEPFTLIHSSVIQHLSERIQGVSFQYVLGYCVSHTTYTWEIELEGLEHVNLDIFHKKPTKFRKWRRSEEWEESGDAEVEEFVRGVLDCEAQPQSTITSLAIHHGKITSKSVRQILKIPKHMFSSLKRLVLTDSPGIDEVGYTALNTLLESSATLETLVLGGNNLHPEAVAVVLNGTRNMNPGLQLFVTCSQFSLENCRLLASVLQHNTGILTKIGLSLYENELYRYGNPRIILEILPGPLKAIQASVHLSYNSRFGSKDRVKFVPQPGCTTWDYVLGYCVSHTSHTWKIELEGFGNEDVERFMQGILDSDSRNISSLSLSGKELTTVGVNQILKLPERFSLLKVPSVLGGCMPVIKNFQEALTELHLGGRRIDTTDLQPLSELLASPSALEIMNIEGSLSTEAVDLILSGLQKNTGLKEFSICYSQFSLENCKSLVTVVQNNCNNSTGGGSLRRLQVAHFGSKPRMWNDNSDTMTLSEIADQRMELQFLPGPGVRGSVTNLMNSSITQKDTMCYALGYCVSHTASTWEITIKFKCNLRYEEVKAFVDGVLDCEYEQQSTITSYSCSDLETLTFESVNYILKLPKHMLSRLETLSLSNNPKIGKGGFAPLVEMLPATLVHLNLSNTGIGVEDCEALNTQLISSSALETLDIGRNHLPPEAVELIFSGLQRTTKLKTLKIDHSKLSPKAYELLSSILRSHYLNLLSVKSCNIGPSETEQLVDALMCKDTLQYLMLGNNPIGNEGANHLCRYLQHSKSLRGVDLSEWLGHWTSSMSYRPPDISGNPVSLQGAKTLTSVLHEGQNTTLETLILPNRFGGWIPESLRNRVTTKQIEWQKIEHLYWGCTLEW